MMKKIGFWATLAIVLGAQVGSGILMLPTTLAPFGIYTIYGWGIACIGAIALAYIFAKLCFLMPETGGPHMYIKRAFGNVPSFFTGWTYWLISWISTSIVVISCVAYLSPFLGECSENTYLFYEILLLAVITYINCVSVNLSGKLEMVLTALKFAPLIIIPCMAAQYFNSDNFRVADTISHMSDINIINQVSLLAFWGFIGVECATTPAGAIENPTRTIPLAIMFGTICAAILYLINCIGIMGAIPGEMLAESKAPYVMFAKMAFSGHADCIMGAIGFVICLGTLNAWTLTSGQIALGLAQGKMLPRACALTNKSGSPYFNIFISSIGIAIILSLTKQKSIAQQVTQIVDFSVISFLFVYLISSLAYLKFMCISKKINQIFIGLFAACFCVWIILNSSLLSILIAMCFTVSGIFVMPFIALAGKKHE